MGYIFKKVPCNLCNANEYKVLGLRGLKYHKSGTIFTQSNTDGERYYIVKCKNCGFIYPRPMPFPDKQQLQKNYSDIDLYFKFHHCYEKVELNKKLLIQLESIYHRFSRNLISEHRMKPPFLSI